MQECWPGSFGGLRQPHHEAALPQLDELRSQVTLKADDTEKFASALAVRERSWDSVLKQDEVLLLNGTGM